MDGPDLTRPSATPSHTRRDFNFFREEALIYENMARQELGFLRPREKRTDDVTVGSAIVYALLALVSELQAQAEEARGES